MYGSIVYILQYSSGWHWKKHLTMSIYAKHVDLSMHGGANEMSMLRVFFEHKSESEGF